MFSRRLLPRFFAVFVSLAILTGGVVLALYFNDRTSEHRLHEQAGLHQVDLHFDFIVHELKVAGDDLLYLARQKILRDYLEKPERDNRETLEDEYRLFCRQRGVYDQIRYLDDRGHERIRINDYNGN